MSATDKSTLDRLSTEPPARFWRSLGELHRTPEFRRAVAREFPDIAGRFDSATDRRTALKLMGASLLMAGLAACKAPDRIVPYVNQPEFTVPGRPKFYATSIPLEGYGMGVLAESHDGRPTKIEGNPGHPASLGGTDAIMQASVWSLYDPDRSKLVMKGNEPAAWDAFQRAIADLRAARPDGAGMGVLFGPTTSPTFIRQLAALKQTMPALRTYRHAPLESSTGLSATEASFGQDLRPVYDLSRADVIVSLGADFLGEGPGKLAYARTFADARRVRKGREAMSRLYAFEAVPSLTGAAADWRWSLRPSEIEGVAAGLMAGTGPAPLLADVAKAGSRVVFIAGERESGLVQSAAHRLNSKAASAAVRYIASFEAGADGDLKALVDDIDGGRVTALLVLDCDPIHSAGDLPLVQALRRLAFSAHWGLHRDGTGRLAGWHVPATHSLESWSDIRAFDGTASIVQPLIAPLYDGHAVHEVLATLAGDFTTSAHDLVRATWADHDDDAWREALKSGVVAGTAPTAVSAIVGADTSTALPPADADAIEVVLLPDPYLRDGANAANLPLQELPRPLSKLVWGNAAEMSPTTAAQLGVTEADTVAVGRETLEVVLPVYIQPLLAEGVVSIALGHGRAVTSDNEAVGQNAFLLRTEAAPWVLKSATVRKGPPGKPAITMQLEHAMEGRDLVREVPLAAFDLLTPPVEESASLFPPVEEPDEAWGMSIDLSACIGCMACVAACAAENNTPVVGADEMARGHDMHWLRVDRYYGGDPAAPETLFQPVPCMQCEEAPCEVVCPVNATVHTHDGLNAQVYNRCVGTRYCSQNCPYKVRRFNFFDYQDFDPASPLSLLMNPDVSVRSRGVMEKCTYCVQRISEARIDADVGGDQPIRDGAVQTACQQACPTRAITFGNIHDKASRVVADKAEPHSYGMLEELGTRPRTTYLAKVTNRPGPTNG